MSPPGGGEVMMQKKNNVLRASVSLLACISVTEIHEGMYVCSNNDAGAKQEGWEKWLGQWQKTNPSTRRPCLHRNALSCRKLKLWTELPFFRIFLASTYVSYSRSCPALARRTAMATLPPHRYNLWLTNSATPPAMSLNHLGTRGCGSLLALPVS